jgi:hypothetical protein
MKRLSNGRYLKESQLGLYLEHYHVGKEMPISRIVIAVPNATIVLLD